MAKKISFDIVADERDAVRAFNHTGDAADRLKGTLGKLGSTSAKVLKPIAAVSSAGSILTSVSGPAAAGLAHVAVSGARLATTLAPLAATVPGLAAGFVLLKQTAVSVGPAMAKSLQPIQKSFEANQKQVDDLATRGLPSLARAFVKVNAPAIQSGMERIAGAANQVAVGVGAWVNSTSGQKAIKTIVEGTATAAERLAPHVTAAAIALGNLAGRAGDGAFTRIGDILIAAADGAKRLADSVTRKDIDDAFKKYDEFADAVGRLPEKLRQLQSALDTTRTFFEQNAAAITQMHLALTGVAIVAGILTGQWLPALAAGGLLVATNFSAVTGVADEVVASWDRMVAGSEFLQGSIEGLSKITDSWGDLTASIAKQLGPLLGPVMDALSQFGETAGESFQLALPFIRVFGAVVIKVLGAAAATFLLLLTGAISAANGIALAFNFLLTAVALSAKGILRFVGSLIGGLGNALASIPGPFHDIGVQLQHAAGEVNDQANAIQNYIDGIHGKTVDVNVVTNYKTGTGTPSGPLKVGYRAAGGPVEAGRPYVVGEVGRELFVPKSDGTILSAARTRAATTRPSPLVASTGSSTTVVVHVHGSTLASKAEIETLVLRALDSAKAKGRRAA